MSNCERIENNTVKLTTVVDGSKWEKAQKKALKKAAGKLNLKGFRKGAAPASLVRRTVGEEYILHTAIDEVAEEALVSMLEEYGVEPISTPSLDLGEINADKAELIFLVPVEPEATLGEWKNLQIEKKTAEVTDEDIENAMKALAEEQATENALTEEETLKVGDKAVINYEVSINGEPQKDKTLLGEEILVGSGVLPEEVSKGMEGMKPEEVREISFTEKAEDGTETPAVAKVTLHEAFRKEVPAMDEALLKTISEKYPDLASENVDELKEKIRANMLSNRQEALDDEYLETLIRTAAENAEVEIPEAMVETEAKQNLQMMLNRLASQGMNLGNLDQERAAMILESMKPEARNRVRNSLVLLAIAKESGAEVTPEEIESMYQDVADETGVDVEKVKKAVSAASVKRDILIEKATQALLDAQSE